MTLKLSSNTPYSRIDPYIKGGKEGEYTYITQSTLQNFLFFIQEKPKKKSLQNPSSNLSLSLSAITPLL
jgi:hypothetical protein